MSFSRINLASLLVFAAAVCIEVNKGGAFFIGRCTCPKVQKVGRINVSDFEVIEKSPACDKDEIILTSVRSDNSTEKICVDLESNIAKNFLKCWSRINKDVSRRMECIERKRRADESLRGLKEGGQL